MPSSWSESSYLTAFDTDTGNAYRRSHRNEAPLEPTDSLGTVSDL